MDLFSVLKQLSARVESPAHHTSLNLAGGEARGKVIIWEQRTSLKIPSTLGRFFTIKYSQDKCKVVV